MARYFFHVHDGASFVDRTGVELPHLKAARIHSVAMAGSLLKEQSETFWNGDEWRMDVTDENGMILFSLMFLATDAPCMSGGGEQRS